MVFNSLEIDITDCTVKFVHEIEQLAKKNNFTTCRHGWDRLICDSSSDISHDWFNFVRAISDLCDSYNVDFDKIVV